VPLRRHDLYVLNLPQIIGLKEWFAVGVNAAAYQWSACHAVVIYAKKLRLNSLVWSSRVAARPRHLRIAIGMRAFRSAALDE
jgi:hypothetical protein